MVAPAVPYVMMGVFATISLCLYIGGCAITKNWLPLVCIIPALFVCFCAVMFVRTTKEGYCEGGKITNDAWLFYLCCGVISLIAMPLVFYHIKKLNATGLGMHLGGDVCTGIGFAVFLILNKKVDDNAF